jgi:hypothetical protein
VSHRLLPGALAVTLAVIGCGGITIPPPDGDVATPDAGSAPADAGECTSIANDGPLVTWQNIAGDPPAATGGVIALGTYYVTAVNVYTGADGGTAPTQTTMRETLSLSAAYYVDSIFLALHQVWWKRGAVWAGCSLRPEQQRRISAMRAAAV